MITRRIKTTTLSMIKLKKAAAKVLTLQMISYQRTACPRWIKRLSSAFPTAQLQPHAHDQTTHSARSMSVSNYYNSVMVLLTCLTIETYKRLMTTR